MFKRIAICDDESIYSSTIFSYIKKYQISCDTEFSTSVFSSGRDLLQAYREPNSFDIIFLDVEMPEINGIEIATKIRKLSDYNVKIIFISHYMEYMQSSFNVEAFNYLQKPLRYETFQKLMNHLFAREISSTSYKLGLSYDNALHIVPLHDLIYMETYPLKERTLQVHLRNETIFLHDTLISYEKNLIPYGFVVPHRGFIVNMDFIEKIANGFIYLKNRDQIPLSRRKEREIIEIFAKHIVTIRNS